VDNFVRTKSIVSTSDLYGINPTQFIGMKYEDVLILKIESANEVARQELKIHHMKRDAQVVSKALSAVKYNEELLAEMGIKRKD
jgi:hypothetical protein